MPTSRSVVRLPAIMAIVLAAGPALASVTVQIGTASARRGAQASIPITLAGTPAAGSIRVEVSYPQSVLLDPDPATACTPAPGTPGSLYVSVVPGRVRLVLVDTEGGTYASALATCRFTVKSNAPLGTHAMPGSGVEVSDPQGGPLAATAGAGAVTVTTCTGCCP